MIDWLWLGSSLAMTPPLYYLLFKAPKHIHDGLAQFAAGWRDGGLVRDNCVDCQDAGECVNGRRCQPAPRFDPDAHELALFRDTGAWWLDPNRWGDQPKPLCEKHGTWRDEKGVCPSCAAIPLVYGTPLTPRSRHCAEHNAVWFGDGPCPSCAKPPCPRCGPDAPMIVMAEHGGVVSMWSCCVCGSDWTQKGKAGWIESKLSRRRREKRLAAERRADMLRFEQGLDTPHDMMRRDTEQAVETWMRPPGGLR